MPKMEMEMEMREMFNLRNSDESVLRTQKQWKVQNQANDDSLPISKAVISQDINDLNALKISAYTPAQAPQGDQEDDSVEKDQQQNGKELFGFTYSHVTEDELRSDTDQQWEDTHESNGQTKEQMTSDWLGTEQPKPMVITVPEKNAMIVSNAFGLQPVLGSPATVSIQPSDDIPVESQLTAGYELEGTSEDGKMVVQRQRSEVPSVVKEIQERDVTYGINKDAMLAINAISSYEHKAILPSDSIVNVHSIEKQTCKVSEPVQASNTKHQDAMVNAKTVVDIAKEVRAQNNGLAVNKLVNSKDEQERHKQRIRKRKKSLQKGKKNNQRRKQLFKNTCVPNAEPQGPTPAEIQNSAQKMDNTDDTIETQTLPAFEDLNIYGIGDPTLKVTSHFIPGRVQKGNIDVIRELIDDMTLDSGEFSSEGQDGVLLCEDMQMSNPGQFQSGIDYTDGKFDDYNISTNQPKGTFGEVTAHVTTYTKKEFARKLIPLQKFTPKEVELLLECQEHPNIPKLYGVIRHGEKIEILQTLGKGHNLLRWMKQYGCMPDKLVLAIVKEITSALDHIHGRNITHMDVKTNNIVFGATGILLIDFGTAKRVPPGEMLRLNSFSGITWKFAAPECAHSQVQTSFDIWSLAVTALHLLTGQTPWSGLVDLQVAFRLRHSPAEVLSAEMLTCIPSTLCEHVKDLLQCMLCVNPGERLTARQILEQDIVMQAGPVASFYSDAASHPIPPPSLPPSPVIQIMDAQNSRNSEIRVGDEENALSDVRGQDAGDTCDVDEKSNEDIGDMFKKDASCKGNNCYAYPQGEFCADVQCHHAVKPNFTDMHLYQNYHWDLKNISMGETEYAVKNKAYEYGCQVAVYSDNEMMDTGESGEAVIPDFEILLKGNSL